ncbi:MAG: metallophosphoesterase family protein [Opitutaceae bacterium]|jgi:putative phosphoesterase|nr:metallophosphoesterase family protein [Opitutaceae bacterium]
MRIAVFSDTHDFFPSLLAERMEAADEIWCLGDVTQPHGLVEFEVLGPPLRVVRGNCDAHCAWPQDLTLERERMVFHLTHIPPRRAPRGVQVLLHGHTHVPRDEMIGGVRWLNPGSASQPRGGTAASFAWLEVNGGKLTRWEVVRI